MIQVVTNGTIASADEESRCVLRGRREKRVSVCLWDERVDVFFVRVEQGEKQGMLVWREGTMGGAYCKNDCERTRWDRK